MVESDPDRVKADSRALTNKLDAIGWGLFFVWIGIAILADLGWALGLLGVGATAIGAQLARRYFGLPIERFGLISGIVLVVWGAWHLLNIRLGPISIPGSLLPILCIVVGIFLFASAWRRKPHD